MESFPFKLIHPDTEEIIAEILQDHIIFHSEHLERNLTLQGITVPFSLRKDYHNKQVLYPGDDLFIKAFITIYYPDHLRPAGLLLK